MSLIARNPSPGLADVVEIPRPDPLLIDVDQVSHLLGWSARTTRRKDSAGLLPRPVRCGGAVRWRADEIRRWVEAGCPNRAAWERLRRS